MLIKKSSGKIYGAELTAAERKAMTMEIKREIVKWDRENMLVIDAIILWQLHEEFGFGAKRLRQFYDNFNSRFLELINHYEMDIDDGGFICTQKLKQIGIDLPEWEKENKNSISI